MSRRNHICFLFTMAALTVIGSVANAQHGISWKAQYFNNHEFSADTSKGHLLGLRDEGALSFDWGNNAPPGMPGGFPADGFAARFLASFSFEAGNHRFEIRADDYFVFFVDEQSRFDSRGGTPGATHNIDVNLTAGTHNLKVEYYEFSGAAYIHLDWKRLDGSGGTTAPAAVPTPFVYYAQIVTAQPARADGSIIHVVKTGDTINAMSLAYEVDPSVIVERNQLSGGGRWIYPGQELVIRDATTTGGSTSTLIPSSGDSASDNAGDSTPPEEPADPPSAIILTDSNEEVRVVEISDSCLNALRGAHNLGYSAEDVVELNRFAVPERNVRGLTPHEWEGEPLGIVARGNLLQDPSAIIHHIEPAMNFNEFVREVLPQYGFTTNLPPAACIEQLSTTDFWLFYTFPETQMPFVGEVSQVLALLEREGMTMIALLARPEDYVPLLETAFLPIVWNYEYVEGASGE